MFHTQIFSIRNKDNPYDTDLTLCTDFERVRLLLWKQKNKKSLALASSMLVTDVGDEMCSR